MKFHGKVAFITGGAIGFGRAFGRALVSEGAAVVVIDTDRGGAERTAAEFTAFGARAIALECNIADRNQVAAAVESTVDSFGGVDILINNAGRHFRKYGQPFSRLTHDEIRELFDVNVIGTINCCLAVRETMKERGGGVIINIASAAAYSVDTAYGVSKLAIRGLTMTFARDFAEDGTRVNGVSPGLIATENALLEYPPEFFEAAVNMHQLIKRSGTMDDIVNAVLFLGSAEGSFMTGQDILVDGGRYLAI